MSGSTSFERDGLLLSPLLLARSTPMTEEALPELAYSSLGLALSSVDGIMLSP
jgi:hypothetical protein